MTRLAAHPKTARQTPTPQGTPTARLRILATTDLHMQLTGYDYVSDSQTARPGLAGIATMIEAARAEAAAQNRGCILLDNGDLLQGSPLAGQLAQMPVNAAHPAVACLNQLGYDAMGLGNHDLDFGLPYLGAVVENLQMPVLASNLLGADLKSVRSAAVIDCPLPSPTNAATQLRIGLLSVMPTLTAVWNKHRLGSTAKIIPAADCLRAAVPALRAQGADLIIVLAHMGIDAQGARPAESAVDLARIPGIDALITGHTHQRFPGADHRSAAGIAPTRGTLMRVPAIMPGHGGSDLGVLDLTVRRDETAGTWQVIGHKSGLRQNTPTTQSHAEVMQAVAPAHAAVRRHLRHPVGETSQTLHNYFALAAPSNIGALCAQATARAIRAAQGGAAPDLPLLIASTAHTTGGREGPDHYLNIPRGIVQRRHLAGLNPHNNEIWLIEVTGATLRRRLEHAAGVFASLRRDGPPCALLKTNVPAFNFEAIYGLTYQIDPCRPEGARIRNLHYEGNAVAATDRFLLATDQFRAAGGAGYESSADADIRLRLSGTTEPEFTASLQAPVAACPAPWSFVPYGDLKATLATSPRAGGCLDQIARLSPRSLGLNALGFLEVELTL